MKEHEDLKKLLKRYLAGDCTPEERTQVEQWYDELNIHAKKASEEQMERDIADIRNRLPGPTLRRVAIWPRYAAAIAAVIVIAVGAYFQFNQSPGLKSVDDTTTVSSRQDIAPGGNRATLKLANGSEITLNGRSDGEIAQEGAHAIYKNADGELVYQPGEADHNSHEAPVFNTLQTPRGGQYHLVLPDGSRVWLNAASSLTYTINGSAQERFVKLEGEAYFEVAKDRERPFRVESRGQVVEVLGTHFNINSYPDEPIVKTTLVEGSVKVVPIAHKGSVILQPGQQAALDKTNHLSVKQADISDVVAWKNGKFSFKQADIEIVMRQLSRWYDVKVIFKGKKPNITLSGEVYRNTHASKVLEILSFYNLDCQIEKTGEVKQIIIQ
ncbi:FecR family protein [Olivibacter domesticus]|uniref:FecR family protein n=1 Tax=Olivibacter domesticus TaxID=407022 RepID=A0A1H7U6M6_OLID1|nr:FecR family protein [Olivibacter domesticus]SEL91937.1 FecR family protein [Olivibacter domesticus]